MQVLDGNAIAGDLYELFGVEMTTRTGICRSWGAAVMFGGVSPATAA